MQVYIGNVPWGEDSCAALRDLLESYGPVASLRMAESGLQFYAFAEMAESDARHAILERNLTRWRGRRITLQEAFGKRK